jgi:2-phospho-L-lactate guanylyltransferase
MSLWAVLPVKPLEQGKSRLAHIMGQANRRMLNEQLYQQTLRILSGVSGIDEIWVVSKDTMVLAIAGMWGAHALLERSPAGLNGALNQVTQLATEKGVGQILILPVDLPLLDKEDVSVIINAAGSRPSIVICPDRDSSGTNALLVSPPGCLEYQFGEGSFGLHCQQARQKHLYIEVCSLPTIAFDLDLPEDYLEYRNLFVVPMGQEFSDPMTQMF